MASVARGLWPGRKRPKKETPEELRQRYLREILRRELEDNKLANPLENRCCGFSCSSICSPLQLVKQINALILKDKKSIVAYQRVRRSFCMLLAAFAQFSWCQRLQ